MSKRVASSSGDSAASRASLGAVLPVALCLICAKGKRVVSAEMVRRFGTSFAGYPEATRVGTAGELREGRGVSPVPR